MIKFNQTVAILLLIFFIVCARAEEPIVVVVNKANPIDKLSRSELIDLFMGKYVSFPNDVKAIPVELNGDNKIKVDFYQNLVGMPLSRVNAYWSRLRFTGRKRTAVFKPNESDLIAFIIANKQAIGYVSRSLITDDLKVVYILNE
ncbi:MAG: ABC-type phosphate transport system substrate-binding protein [Alteromonadaceae bacterium]|jgi:ABC-type phosphate transport system substrate-binding protein